MFSLFVFGLGCGVFVCVVSLVVVGYCLVLFLLILIVIENLLLVFWCCFMCISRGFVIFETFVYLFLVRLGFRVVDFVWMKVGFVL